MDQHPIPRQITTFEFKLIGFMTLKQFIYLVVFIPAGFIVYKIFPLPLINLLLGILVGAVGFALAFVPVNDRPLDEWIKDLFKRLLSPTQYIYHKQDEPIYFLKNLFFLSDPHRVMTHVESKEKLAAYLNKTQGKAPVNSKRQAITGLLEKPSTDLKWANKKLTSTKIQPTVFTPLTIKDVSIRKSFFTGVVKNHKLIPIPGILIYIKDEEGKTMRLLKTNPHGVFATFNALTPGVYLFEFKDPKSTYFFDTMKINIENVNTKPFEFFSKELM